MSFGTKRTKVGDTTGPAFLEFFQNFEGLLLDQQGKQNTEGIPGMPGLAQLTGDARARGVTRSSNLASSVARQELSLQKEFGPQFLELQQQLGEQAISGDPLASGLRDFALQGVSQAGGILEDLEGGGLPSSIESNIQERSRVALASRGITDSGAGAVFEAANIAGGEESFRERRIAQAQGILGSASAGFGFTNVPGLKGFSPSQFAPGFQNFGGMFQSFIQPQQFRSNLRFQEASQGREITSEIGGSLLGSGLGSI